MRRAKLAILTDLVLDTFLEECRPVRMGTPYGLPSPIKVGRLGGLGVALLRSGSKLPAYRVNPLADVWAANQLGVERIIAIDRTITLEADGPELGAILAPNDLIDLKRRGPTSFLGEPIRIDMTNPLCPELRSLLIEAGAADFDGAYGSVEGERHYTPAEAEMFRRLGCRLLGSAGFPEALLTRELGICYALLCMVTDRYSEGRHVRIGAKRYEGTLSELKSILSKIVASLPARRACGCFSALGRARAETLETL